MNKQRRKDIQSVINMVEDAKTALEPLFDEEEEYHENMPENMQDSGKGEVAEEACRNMEEAISQLEEIVSTLETAME